MDRLHWRKLHASGPALTTPLSTAATTGNGSKATPECSAEEFNSIIDAYLVSEEVEKYYYVALFVFATILNCRVLVLVTCGNDGMRQRTVYPKIALLSTFDLIAVVAMVMHNFDRLVLFTLTDISLPLQSILFCKIPTFLYYWANFVSTWTVVLMAVERYAAIKYPLKVLRYQSKRLLYICILILVSVSAVLVAPKLATVSSFKVFNITMCDAADEDLTLYHFDLVYTTMLLVLSTIIPCSGLLIFTALLILEVNEATKRAILLRSRGLQESDIAIISMKQIAKSRCLRVAVMVLSLAIVYNILQIPDVIVWMLNHLFADRAARACEYFYFSTAYSYVSIFSDLVTITNPLIFLVCKWIMDFAPVRPRVRRNAVNLTFSSSIDMRSQRASSLL